MNFQKKMMLKKFIGPSILVLIGSYMINLSWFKWPDCLIDYGRELYVPWQINQGKVLFADINHLYGPLSHYFNAFLFQVFGTGLSTLAFFNIMVTVFITYFIYTFLKSSLGDLVATIAGICFLVIFAFSQYTGYSNYNFICPYSHEVTYGIFLFFLTLFLFNKYILNLNLIYPALIGLMLGLIFLTKVEIFLAAFISMFFGLLIIWGQLKPARPQKHICGLFFFFLLPIIVFFIYFSLHMPWMDALRCITASYENIFVNAMTHNIYYLHVSGLDYPYYNLSLILRYAFAYIMFFIFTGFTAYCFARSIKRKPVYGAIVIIMAIMIMIISVRLFSINWMDIARPYPVFILLFLVYLINNLIIKRKDKTYVSRHLPFIVFVIFAFLLLIKMVLNVHFYHYGFALAMPAAIVMITLFFYFIPNYISRWGNKIVAMSFTGLFVLFTLLFYFNTTKYLYDLKTYPISHGRDRFFTFDATLLSYGPVINKTLEYIDRSLSKNDTFIVMPEGVMLNYLSRRGNPCRYFEFTPNFVDAVGEENIIHEIAHHRPSLIILSKKNTSEHGAKYFGVDYALNIFSWVINNYDTVLPMGDITLPGSDFGLIITKLKK